MRQFGSAGIAGHVNVSQGPTDLSKDGWELGIFPLEELFGALSAAARPVAELFYWTHVLAILAFLAYIPTSKHLHIFVAAINVFFGRTRARGRLEKIDFEQPEADVRFGSARVSDMTWKQMLDTMSCTECGRCQDVCPAYNTGKPLSPKLLIMAMRDQLMAEGPKALASKGSYTPPPIVPGMPSPNPRLTLPTWLRSRPFVAASVNRVLALVSAATILGVRLQMVF